MYAQIQQTYTHIHHCTHINTYVVYGFGLLASQKDALQYEPFNTCSESLGFLIMEVKTTAILCLLAPIDGVLGCHEQFCLQIFPNITSFSTLQQSTHMYISTF